MPLNRLETPVVEKLKLMELSSKTRISDGRVVIQHRVHRRRPRPYRNHTQPLRP